MSSVARLESLFHSLPDKWLDQILRGLEKEHLRVDQATGAIAKTTHPKTLGSALTHDAITMDFSEALIELVTPPVQGLSSLMHEMNQLSQWVTLQLDQQGELLWVGSMPGQVLNEDDILIADFGSSSSAMMKRVYRQGLVHRYGKMMQIIAGLHYNVSFPEVLFEVLYQESGSNLSFSAFKSAKYMATVRQFFCHYWILPYLFGASPACAASSVPAWYRSSLSWLGSESAYLPWGTSLRLSGLGYQNHPDLNFQANYNTVTDYAKSLKAATEKTFVPFEAIGVKDHEGCYQQLNASGLQIENEYYSPIRPKQIARPCERPSAALASRGVAYLEMRLLDLHPDFESGQPLETYAFIDLLLLYCLLQECGLHTCEHSKIAQNNFNRVVKEGRRSALTIVSPRGEKQDSFYNASSQLLDELMPLAEWMDRASSEPVYQASLLAQSRKIDDVALTPSAQALSALLGSDKSYHDFMLDKSQALHKTWLQGASGLSRAYLKNMREKAAVSLEKQKALEAMPQMPFDAYLAQYFAQ